MDKAIKTWTARRWTRPLKLGLLGDGQGQRKLGLLEGQRKIGLLGDGQGQRKLGLLGDGQGH